ncbi:tetratricopeptide repeat protein [Kluyvera ascorbata]|uniref:tetratricopeptide repeat protein n=1 Tax=Kluyvera ascorbata TaxID=51288 RepID=UPI0039F491F8
MKKILSIVMLAVLTGCSGGLSNATDADQKEYILTQLNDYQGLIEIYRNKLSVKDDDDERYHLSQLYNKIGDYSSSNIYLAPLVEKNKDKKYLLLQAKNYIELGHEDKAEPILKELLLKDGSNGELWNLQGVLFAQQGHYAEATTSFEKARGLFYNEEIVINNIAMMAILQQDYQKARDYLLSLYSRKKYQSQTVYNLVYTLVKTNDYTSARKVILDEKLSPSNPDALIHSLANLSPREQLHLGNPAASEMNAQDVDIPASIAQPPQIVSNPSSENLPNKSKDVIPSVESSGDMLISGTCSEKALLEGPIASFVGNIHGAKEIAKLTSAHTTSGDRLALYSAYPINFIVMPKAKDNVLELELFNSQPVKSIYQSQMSILKNHPRIHKIELINNGSGSTIMRVVAEECKVLANVTRASANGKYKEKIIIDLSYK